MQRWIAVDPPYTRERALARIESDPREWADGRRILAIEERDSGRFVGRIVLWDWPQFGETELGWTLTTAGRGHGYATEGARAVAGWAFANLVVPYLISLIDPLNERSKRVAERLGMTVLREDELDGEPHLVYALQR